MVALGHKPNGFAWRCLLHVGAGEKAGRIYGRPLTFLSPYPTTENPTARE